MEPIERAQLLRVGEATEQIAERNEEGPHRDLGRQCPRGQELLGARAAQRRPVRSRPSPVGPTRFGAVLQDQTRRVRAGSPIPCGGCVMQHLSLIHISEPTRLGMISYAVFCLKKKKK